MMLDTPLYEETHTAGPAAAAPVLERLSAMERFRGEAESAVDRLVTALLAEHRAREGDLSTVALALQGFETVFRDLTRQLDTERTNADLRHTSLTYPKTATLTFVCGNAFGCNLKYAWLEAHRRAQDHGWSVWFLPRDEHQEQLARQVSGNVFPAKPESWAPIHLEQALSTSVVVLNDHFLHPNPHAAALFAGARQVQLWHGVSIKELGLKDLPDGRGLTRHRARTLATSGPFSRFVGTAERAEPEWRRWFAFERYAALGYARNDILYREPEPADLVGCDLDAWETMRAAKSAGRRVVLYAPTFRDANPRWIHSAGLTPLAEAIRARGDLLVVQLHPLDGEQAGELASRHPSAVIVQPRTDVAPLLREASCLVTDYSSVMFDFLHVDRPIALYRPDHADYVARSRTLFDAKLAVMPGPVFHDSSSLADALRQPELEDTPEHRSARRALLRRLFDHQDGHSADRLMGLLQEEHLAARESGSPPCKITSSQIV